MKNLTSIARQYRELQALTKELEKQMDSLKQQMIADLDAKKVDKLQAGEYTISHMLYESNRLDSKRFQEEQPTLYMMYVKPSIVNRFQVA